ncbi:Hypothetical protein R9X50_00513300 [Acrodontium crateriforme]|uniref:Peptidase S53 domain-containing protein n=1 Tax=Acrodontium crateriforme TaxID=150365 RepID=A0AAQ3M5I1_9PEZI|nr:Hypothetical protein R9X50_00513300 [Acrodontium crateriforme]
MRSSLLQVLAAAATIDVAASLAIPDTLVVHESRNTVTTGSKLAKRARVDKNVKLPVRIGLKANPESEAKAEQWLMDVSHPESAKYGQHWTQDDVIKAFQPTDEAVKGVKEWLTTVIKEDRITHTDNKGWFAFDATTEELEKLTNAKYYEHHDASTGRVLLATDEYSVPASLKQHIDLISPGVKGVQVKATDLATHQRRRGRRQYIEASSNPASSPTNLTTCDVSVTPACIQALYGFKALDPNCKVNKYNSLGVFESGDTYAQEDLNLFYKNFTQYIPQGTGPILKSVDGGHAPVTSIADAGGESDLDFELAIPIVYPQTTTLYQTDDDYYVSQNGAGTGDFNTFMDALDGSYCYYEGGNDKIDPVYPDNNPGGYTGKLMCGVYKPTNVISISYGDQESNFTPFYQQRQCREFLKLGLQGVSIFFASGDDGVGGPTDVNDNGCIGKDKKVFSPASPNNCPWITNVGATKIAPGKSVHDPEVAANDPKGHPYLDAYSSGGGFSNIYGIPWYQKDAVASYFENYSPPYDYYYNGDYNNSATGLYNRNGRGYPDVAAVGDAIAVYKGGNYHTSGGTSASTPIFASLINRIVEERLKSGKGPVGFINPALYFNPHMLNDITSGNNPACGVDGFYAVKGWDPVTGLGTPNYPKMSQFFNSLP